MLSGRTRQGKLVHFAPPGGAGLAPGRFVDVRVERAAPAPSCRVARLGRSGLRRTPGGPADPGGRRLKARPVGTATARPPDREHAGGGVQWAVVSVFGKVLRAGESKKVRSLAAIVPSINALEPEIQALSDAELARKTVEFKERLDTGEDMNDLLVEAFAVVREAGCAPSASAISTSSSWAAWPCISGGSPR